MKVVAEVSLYPLRTESLEEPIEAFCRALEARGLELAPGAMSTRVRGEPGEVFDGLKDAFERVAAGHQVAVTIKVSNACPGCEA